MGFLIAVRRFFTWLFGTTPPAEDVGTTALDYGDDVAANHAAAGNRSEGFPAHPSDRARRPAWAWWTVLVLTSGGLLSMVVAITVIGRPRSADLPPPPSAAVLDPCAAYPMMDAELERLSGLRLWERLRREPLPRTDQTLQDKVDAAFEPIYTRIPKFLDWHYSLAGQYTQIARVILDWLESEIAPTVRDRLLKSQLAQAVLDRLLESDLARAAIDLLPDSEDVRAALDRLQQGVDSRLFGDLPDRVRYASAHVERVMKEEMRTLVEEGTRAETQKLPDLAYAETWTRCMDRDAYERMLRATVSRFTNSAAPTGIIAVGAAYRGAAASRALVSGLKRRLLSRIPGGRLLSGTSGTAGRAAGAIGGGLVGSAAWLLVDVLVLFADEYFNRDDLEAELAALIDEQKAEVKAALSEAVAKEKSEALGDFLPSELGVRRRSP